MARIFNIYFSHEETLYSAIVSVHTTPFSTEYVLGNLDAELRRLLPGTKIIAQPQGHLSFQDDGPQKAGTLTNAILDSLAKHLARLNAPH